MARAIVTTAVGLCCVLVAAGCAGSGGKQAARSTTTTRTTSCSGCIDVSPTAAEIQLARSSSPLFSLFPAEPGKKACFIAAGIGRLRGWCRTSVRRAQTHEPAIVVSFTEAWFPESRCPPWDHCLAVREMHHTWTFVEGSLPWGTPGAGLHILATRQSGEMAPQFED